MEVVLSRVDDRLIHGQVVISIAKKMRISHILIIDDETAEDAFMKYLVSMVAPEGVAVSVCTAAQGLERLRGEGGRARTMLLFKRPETVMRLHEAGYPLGSLNIGGLCAGQSRRRLCGNIYASEQERAIFRKLIEEGVDVYIRAADSEPKVSVAPML